MENLVTLQIRIVRYSYRGANQRRAIERAPPETRVLKQLVGVKARKKFVVEIPWLRSVVQELEGATFELVEGEGAVDVVDRDLT